MVMAPGTQPGRRRKSWRLLRLRCLFRRHAEAGARLYIPGDHWAVHAHYCRRCLRLFDTRAKRF